MNIREVHSKWIYVVPINNLELTTDINYEFRIDKVTFVDSKRLPYIRKRLGFPQTIGNIKNNKCKFIIDRFFEGVKTFAILRLTGTPDDLEEEAIRRIREELSILSLSQLGFSRRRNNCFPQISQENPSGKRSFLIVNSENNTWIQANQTLGKVGVFILDKEWKQFHSNLYFPKLIKILRKDISIKNSWLEDLRNAAVLVGQSQCSVDVPQAFLWNMIALELLLTQSGDSCIEALPERAEAFLGWTGFWQEENYVQRIKAVYKKRCDFVHKGNRRLITLDDLFFTDTLLENLFLNIVCHIKIFQSKQDVIDFSKKVEAEHTLGIKTKVQPKTFRFLNPNYTKYDYEFIR